MSRVTDLGLASDTDAGQGILTQRWTRENAHTILTWHSDGAVTLQQGTSIEGSLSISWHTIEFIPEEAEALREWLVGQG
jgi:hypothetical protein